MTMPAQEPSTLPTRQACSQRGGVVPVQEGPAEDRGRQGCNAQSVKAIVMHRPVSE
jgi:hypothetical protein